MVDLVLGKNYRWVGQKEVLTYIGRNWSGNGYWHQFKKVDEPGRGWCEVTDQDLRTFARFEEVPAIDQQEGSET